MQEDFDHLHRWEPARWNPDLRGITPSEVLWALARLSCFLASALASVAIFYGLWRVL